MSKETAVAEDHFGRIHLDNSITVCNPTSNSFQVAIIPYTMAHTNFCDIQVGTVVNLEFDILGKYIARLQQL